MSFEEFVIEDKTSATDHRLLIKFNKAIIIIFTEIFVLKLLMQNYNTGFMLQRTKFY